MAACCLITSQAAWADGADLEKDIQASLEQSRQQVSQAAQKLGRGLDASPEIARIKILSENIRITNLLLEERFRLREEKVKTLGSSALSRQQAMAEGYRKAIQEYLEIVDNLPSAVSGQLEAISKLKTLLDKLLPKKKRPIIGSLPYKHLNYPSSEPSSGRIIAPAYHGGDKTVGLDDTKDTPEAPITKEIAALAQSLSWSPVSIYEYVKNNIQTEWYWGCMKGAEETFHQKSGNDCDQATLFAALLRASGYPTRYVRGSVEFIASGTEKPIDRIRNLFGIDDPARIAQFLQKVGIPFKPIIAGGGIANFQIEHVWVESQIPYANYRGAIIDVLGKTWLGLDTSIKVKGYQQNQAKDIYELSAISGQLSAVRDKYLGIASSGTGSTPFELNQTPLEYLQSSINSELSTVNSELSYADFLRSRTLIPEIMNILPAGLQFKEISITNEYTSIPDELKHKVRFTAKTTQNSELLNIELDVFKLSNQQITITYEPETVQDQETINAWGGLDNTPAYLVRLRPVLAINGQRMAVGKDGLPMGSDYDLTIELTSPKGTEKTTNTLIVGNLTAIGMVAQKAVSAQQSADSSQLTAESLLHKEAINFIDRWNKAEDELASLLHLAIARPIPTVVTLGGMIDVTYLLDMPHGFTWKGVYLDADVRRIEAVKAQQSASSGQLTADSSERVKLFMQLSGLQGSVLENRIFEDDFQVESISTAKLVQISGQQSAISAQLYTIDKTNIETDLPTLDLDDNIKDDIRNSVNQGLVVRMPQANGLPLTAISYRDWSGIGYITENPETGESGWMLSGMIAGGCPVDLVWLEQHFQNTLSSPYTGPVNADPLSAAWLVKVSTTDKQLPPATVGTAVPKPLAVFVSDSAGKPVPNATVKFSIIAGGGNIQCLGPTGSLLGVPAEDPCTTTTGKNGFAKARLTLGTKTDANPWYLKINEQDTNYSQIGLNLITASAANHTGEVPLAQPFEQYGAPDVETLNKITVQKVLGDDNTALPNTPAGTLKARVLDQYQNPISNVVLKFTVKDAKSTNPMASLPAENLRNLLLYKSEDCPNPYPIHGDCNLATAPTITAATQYYGAQVETILGNTIGTTYTVQAAAQLGLASNPMVSFTLYSEGDRLVYYAYMPPALVMRSLVTMNDQGQEINAAKAGTALKTPLAAELMLFEDEYTLAGPLHCLRNGVETTGYNIIAKGTTATKKITNGAVTFTPKEGGGAVAPIPYTSNGRYEANYTTGAAPAKNLIEAWGEASVTIPEILYDPIFNQGEPYPRDIYSSEIIKYCIDNVINNNIRKRTIPLRSSQYGVFYKDTYQQIFGPETPSRALPYTVYGVNAALKIEPSIVLLNDEGYSTSETTFSYTILPPEYNASAAMIYLWKSEPNQNATDLWDGYVTGDQTKGTGSTALIRGTKFDINRRYEAQVVLNNGSEMEVKGDKKNIPAAQLNVMTDEGANSVKADEIKFGDGSKPNKRYKIEMKSAALQQACHNNTGGMNGTIRSMISSGQTIPSPGNGYYAATYNLDFTPGNGNCIIGIKDSSLLKDKFIVSNMSKAYLDARIAELLSQNSTVDLNTISVVYGGLGSKLQLTINGTTKAIPIEPVGVIVLGIDGLRQDVLYPDTMDDQPFEDVHEPETDYFVDAQTLPGLKQILIGDPHVSATQEYVMLPKVTAIFPSITLASWASIFSGKMPNETGIPGNEFFARDLYNATTQFNLALPGMATLPSGMVTLSDGAFYNGSLGFLMHNLLPAHNYAESTKNKIEVSSPNQTLAVNAQTIYTWIAANVTKYKNPDACMSGGECRSAVFFNHYARGADWWGTIDLPWWQIIGVNIEWLGETFRKAFGTPQKGAETLDETPTKEVLNFLSKYYPQVGNGTPAQYDTTKRFPALFTVYYGGPDHYAHDAGMNGLAGNYTGYKDYFQKKTDGEIKKVIDKLKGINEFDNKIFIIVADHGHTAMPTSLTFVPTSEQDGLSRDAETSCELVLDGFNVSDVREAEQANNNLHIWELGEAFKMIGENGWGQYKVLAPKEIAKLYKKIDKVTNQIIEMAYGASAKVEKADIIVGLNGPMAHVYLTDMNNLGKIAELFRLTFDDHPAEAAQWWDIDDLDYSDFKKNTIGRLKASVDKILVRVGGNYCVFDGLNDDGSVRCAPADPFTVSAYVDAWTRINGMNHKDRSGDIVLIMRDATLGNAVDRYTTGVACKSWHGSLSPSDSYVPFIVSYPGGNKAELEKILQKDTLCKTDYSNCKGNWKLSDVVKEIISEQYK